MSLQEAATEAARQLKSLSRAALVGSRTANVSPASDVGAYALRATMGHSHEREPIDEEASSATLVSGFIARRSNLFRHGVIAAQFRA